MLRVIPPHGFAIVLGRGVMGTVVFLGRHVAIKACVKAKSVNQNALESGAETMTVAAEVVPDARKMLPATHPVGPVTVRESGATVVAATLEKLV